ncbi:MAG: porin family protein [Bacteroidia bacterium]
MRTLIIAGLLSLCLSTYSQDQTPVAHKRDSRSGLHLGLKFGLNHSDVYDSQGEGFAANPKYGFAGGAFLQIPIGRYLGIQPEVLLSQKGFSGSGRIAGVPYDLTRTSTFIDVPLLLTFKPVKWVYFVAGPQYSYLSNQFDVFKNGGATVTQEQNFSNDNIRKNVLGAVVGVDVNLGRMVLSGRYGWDMQTNNGNGTSSTPRYKNVYLQGTIGFRIF